MLHDILEQESKARGFSHWGLSPLARPFSFEIYRRWIANGQHGEMGYLKKHLEFKQDPARHFPFAQTAIVFAMPYGAEHPHAKDFPLTAARVARYAAGDDYHRWLTDRLREIIARLRINFPEDTFEAHTDSAPILERDLAVRAGLGWIGRNGCVIHPKHGSLFLIGEILTSFGAVGSETTIPDLCGKCRACVDVCPTQAIQYDRTLDARKCLSYLSIESREVPEEPIRSRWGDWFFGCDLCQTICPWNHKVLGLTPTDISRDRQNLPPIIADERMKLVAELSWILETSGKQIQKAFARTALNRAGPFGLKRNAMMVAVGRNLIELKAPIEALSQHPKLGDLAIWAAGQLFDELVDRRLPQ